MENDLDPPIRDAIDQLIVRSPLAALLGVRAEAIATDDVRLRLPFRRELTTVGMMVHGGAIASLVDIAATAACWAHPSASLESRGSTVGFAISYLAPGHGQDLVARARVVQRGQALCVCEVSVHDASDEVVARALVTYRLSVPRPPEETLNALFAGRSPEAQRSLLATLERAGAGLYRAWAAATNDPEERKRLEEAARREEQNAEVLETRR